MGLESTTIRYDPAGGGGNNNPPSATGGQDGRIGPDAPNDSRAADDLGDGSEPFVPKGRPAASDDGRLEQ